MAAFDQDPVAWALTDLREAGRAAVEALRRAHPNWSQEDIAARLHFSRSAVSRLLGTDTRLPSAEVCKAIDRFCQDEGVWPGGIAPFSLAELWQVWHDARKDAAAAAAESAGPVQIQIGNPPPAATALQPRRGLVNRIAAAAGSGGVVLQAVAVGDGGVGKTQLARAVWDKAEPGAESGVRVRIWVNASNLFTILSGYAAAAVAVRQIPNDHGDDERAARAFLDWCGQARASWLVVLDDVALDPVDALRWWPPPTRTGRVVATTRRRDIHPPGSDVVQVEVFTPEEALTYLQQRLSDEEIRRLDARADARDGATDLAAELGYLPLALAQAASYILRKARTCTSYLTEFRNQKQTVAQLFPRLDAADSYAHTVATAWTLAVTAADEIEPIGLARPALVLAAVLSPAGIPDSIWTSEAGRNYLASHRSSRPSEQIVAVQDGPVEVISTQALDAVRNLHLFSILTHTPAAADNSAGIVRVHGLVQRSTRDQLTDDELDDTIWAGADAVAGLWPPQRHDPLLAANAEALLDGRTQVLWSTNTAHPLLFHLPFSLADAGQLTLAVQAYTDLLAAATTARGPDHLETLSVRNNLAICRAKAGDVTGATAELEQLLTDELRVLGPDHGETLATRSNLAFWRGRAGDVTGAIAGFEQVLTNQLRLFGTDHPQTLIIRHNLAFWRGEAGDVAGAIAGFEQLLTNQLRVFGADHPNILLTRSSVATSRGRAGDVAGAIAGFEQVLTDQLRLFGADHPNTLTTRANLAFWRGEAGDVAGAIAGFEQLLIDQLRALSADHPNILSTRSAIAILRGRAGDVAAAIAGLEQLLTDRLRVLGADHPDTLTTRYNLACWRGEVGDTASAITGFAQLLTDQLRVLGPDHPDTLTTRARLDFWRQASPNLPTLGPP